MLSDFRSDHPREPLAPGAPRGRRARLTRRAPADLSLPADRLSYLVAEDEADARLDRFLTGRLSWRSRTSLVEMIEAGQVRVGGLPVTRKAHRLSPGDLVEVAVPPPQEEVRHAELAALLAGRVLHEDADLVAVDKPAGLTVHPVGRIRANTLIQAMHWRYRHGPGAEPDVVPRICHRLDRDTSGVLVLAKNLVARSALGTAIEEHALEKEYLALLSGQLRPDRGRIDEPIGPDPDAEVGLMMTTRPDGAPSTTHWEVLERLPGACLVRLRIVSGRQHQIRVHTRALGHPVLLDPLYGEGPTSWPAEGPPLLARQALHAHRLVLPHPRTKAPLRLEAPLPPDMAALVAALRQLPLTRVDEP